MDESTLIKILRARENVSRSMFALGDGGTRQLTGEISPLLADFGGNRSLRFAERARVIQPENIRSANMIEALEMATSIKERFGEAEKLIHFRAPKSGGDPAYPSMDPFLPSPDRREAPRQLDQGEMRAGMVIPGMSPFPKPGQNFEAFKKSVQGQNAQNTPTAAPRRSSMPATRVAQNEIPKNRVFSKVQEVPSPRNIAPVEEMGENVVIHDDHRIEPASITTEPSVEVPLKELKQNGSTPKPEQKPFLIAEKKTSMGDTPKQKQITKSSETKIQRQVEKETDPTLALDDPDAPKIENERSVIASEQIPTAAEAKQKNTETKIGSPRPPLAKRSTDVIKKVEEPKLLLASRVTKPLTKQKPSRKERGIGRQIQNEIPIEPMTPNRSNTILPLVIGVNAPEQIPPTQIVENRAAGPTDSGPLIMDNSFVDEKKLGPDQIEQGSSIRRKIEGSSAQEPPIFGPKQNKIEDQKVVAKKQEPSTRNEFSVVKPSRAISENVQSTDENIVSSVTQTPKREDLRPALRRIDDKDQPQVQDPVRKREFSNEVQKTETGIRGSLRGPAMTPIAMPHAPAIVQRKPEPPVEPAKPQQIDERVVEARSNKTSDPIVESALSIEPRRSFSAQPVVQRMWEEHSDMSASAGSSGQIPQNDGAGTETDLDALAEQVLPLVKHLLEIEIERTGGRSGR